MLQLLSVILRLGLAVFAFALATCDMSWIFFFFFFINTVGFCCVLLLHCICRMLQRSHHSFYQAGQPCMHSTYSLLCGYLWLVLGSVAGPAWPILWDKLIHLGSLPSAISVSLRHRRQELRLQEPITETLKSTSKSNQKSDQHSQHILLNILYHTMGKIATAPLHVMCAGFCLLFFFFWLKLFVWSNSVLNCDDSFAIKA